MFKKLAIVAAAFILLNMAVVLAGEDIVVDKQEAQFSRMKPDVASVFLRIRNNTKKDDALLGVEVNIKGAYAELHNVKDGAMMKVSRIPVPSEATVQLKRGGLHIMLFNLPIEAKKGEEFTLTLIFERLGKKDIKAKFSSGEDNMHRH
jgi:copper(I)-binding protein